MKWLNKWFLKQWIEAKHQYENKAKEFEPERDNSNMTIGVATGRSRHDLRSKGMNFVIYPASGGHIVEYQSYDEKTDRSEGKLHIIPTDDDIGQTLGHIVTLECLRK